MNMYWEDAESFHKIKEALNKNEIVLASGDTVLGLFGTCTQQAYEKINQIKQRSNRPYLVIIRSKEVLHKFIDQELSQKLQKLISLCWPGPVTMIFKAHKNLPDYMKYNGTIAVRVPNHVELLQLLQSYDGLFSTSANIHTKPIPETLQEVDVAIKQQVGAICVNKNASFSQVPSTILDCSADKVAIIRKGSDLSEEVENLLKTM